MMVHVYRLCTHGERLPKERWPALVPAYGDLTLLKSAEHWGQLVLVALLCVNGEDVLPQLSYVEPQHLQVRRGIIFRGEEAGYRHGLHVPQIWLCTPTPILRHEWAVSNEGALI